MKIRQSVDQVHKNAINHLTEPWAIYQALVERYASSNEARLRQLLRKIYEVSTQTGRSVQEKVDDLKRLRAQINTQDKDLVIYEKMLIIFLQMSMDSSFDTTIEILNALKEANTLEKVQSALESKELGLASSAIKDEIANAAGNHRGWGQRGSNKRKGKARVEDDDGKLAKLKATGGCYTCGGMHYKTECSVWR
jgi:hypothetical protein